MSIVPKLQVKDWPYLVGGAWVRDGEVVEVRSPFDGSVVGRTWRGGSAQAAAAVSAAVSAFQKTRKLASYEKQQILRGISDAIRARREEFATLIALEAGKPIKTARAEVDRGIFTFAVAARRGDADQRRVAAAGLAGFDGGGARELCGGFRWGRYWRSHRLTFR